MRKLLKQSRILMYENVHARKREVDMERPVFSFTFDDAPQSAATTGRAILEDAGAAGTYYLALGLRPGSQDHEPLVSAEEMRSLHAAGHDIQCHTYSHMDVRNARARDAMADCHKNRQAIMEITGQSAVAHFAYPFGMVGLASKQALGDVYKTMRTVDFGINHGTTDMSHLRAVDIFSREFDRQRIHDVIGATLENNAWTIFYTHEVTDNPGEWGANPADLQWLVRECASTAADILTVSQAYSLIDNIAASA